MEPTDYTPEEMEALGRRMRIVGLVAVGLALLLILASAFTSKVDQVNELPLAPARLMKKSAKRLPGEPAPNTVKPTSE